MLHAEEPTTIAQREQRLRDENRLLMLRGRWQALRHGVGMEAAMGRPTEAIKSDLAAVEAEMRSLGVTP